MHIKCQNGKKYFHKSSSFNKDELIWGASHFKTINYKSQSKKKKKINYNTMTSDEPLSFFKHV